MSPHSSELFNGFPFPSVKLKVLAVVFKGLHHLFPNTISLPLLSYHHHLISLPATLPHVHLTVAKLASLVILECTNRAPASEPLLLLFLLTRSFFHKSLNGSPTQLQILPQLPASQQDLPRLAYQN